MEALLNFIKEYGALILAALSVVVGVVAAIIKRRPKTLDEFISIVSEVNNNIPYLVSIQEQRIGSGYGDQKKTAVLTEALREVSSHLGRVLSNEESDYCISQFSSMVECVLDTPQKKGGHI